MLTRLTAVEAKLFLRDPGAPLTVIGIPVALLLVFGLMPDANRPSEDFGGQIPLSAFIAPLSVAILLGMLALTLFPAAMAAHREKGVLRRLAASPVPPSRLIVAQLLVNLAAALVVVLVIVVGGRLVLGLALPANPGGFLLSLVLGVVALFSVGLLIAALAPTGRAASGIGTAAFFPMLALGGVWVPKEDLPGALQHVADVLPLGATLNALRATWTGGRPEPLQLAALAVFALVCGAVATRVFRWS
ncbi:ABC transporter permease [Amycolatopsis thermophila]|uniref:Transport permease protein n=1 Tax=Amycolatopsis thermophila TaxID=206084 RepID=A0ABU0F4Z3_9PSEU|nr:ABC transporter permease [Amycolatopsis thermophila]MDQ0382236.1 ABC-2 type transport system permease protein [Amycolatopsis thermophila]